MYKLSILILLAIILPGGINKKVNIFETPKTRDYRQDMRDFVQNISAYTKKINPGFLIVPQNGLAILTEDGKGTGRPISDYIKSIDGVGQESLLYGYENDNEATPESEQSFLFPLLDIAKVNGVKILISDYCRKKTFVNRSYSKNAAKGYISFAADHRELDNIPEYPDTPYNVNTSDISTLEQAANFLYLINTGAFNTKESFLKRLRKTDYDLLIIDAFFEGTEELTHDEVASLKIKANGSSRLVIAYMSIGEAENYRLYWSQDYHTASPTWLEGENPEWPGNYKVRYWNTEWKKNIYGNSNSYIKKILDAGFDGVYLDVIDAFEYFESK